MAERTTMDSYMQPMSGSGMDTDILSGEPRSRILTQEDEQKERRRARRERDQQLLIAELTADSDAKEIFRRLVRSTFDELNDLFTSEMDEGLTWRKVQKIRIGLQLMEDVIGRIAVDETARYALMGQIAKMLHTDIPAKSEVLDG